MSQNAKPVHEIRLGRIRAAIWSNQTENHDIWFNIILSRLYKDGDHWKDTSTFSRDDLPIVAKVADMSYAWIWEQDTSTANSATQGKSSNGQRRASPM
jgi:hypothetical protein